jgi:hypothetical protein
MLVSATTDLEFDICGSRNNDAQIGKALVVYPNPANQFLFAEIPSQLVSESFEVLVTTTEGKHLPVAYQVDGSRLKLSTASLSTGVYQLTVRSRNLQFFARFVTEN